MKKLLLLFITALAATSCQKDIVDDMVATDIDPLEGVNLAYEKQMIEEAEDRFSAAEASYSGKSASSGKTSGFESFSRIQNDGDLQGKKTTRYDVQVWLNGFGLHYGSNPNNPTAKLDESWKSSKAYLFYHEDIDGVNHRFAGVDMGPDKSAFIFSSKDGAVKPKTWTFKEDNLDMVYYDLPLSQAFDEYVAIQGIVSGATGELHGCDLAYETEIGYETEYAIIDSDEGEITIDANLEVFSMVGMLVDVDPENWDDLVLIVTDSYNKPGSARTTLEYSLYRGTTAQLDTALNSEYIQAFIRCAPEGPRGYIVHDTTDIEIILAGEFPDLLGKYIINDVNKKPFKITNVQYSDIDDPRFSYDKLTIIRVDSNSLEEINAVFASGREVEIVDESEVSFPLMGERDEYVVISLNRQPTGGFYDVRFIKNTEDDSYLTRDSVNGDFTEVFGIANWISHIGYYQELEGEGNQGLMLRDDYIKRLDFGDDEVASSLGAYNMAVKINSVNLSDGKIAVSLVGTPDNFNAGVFLIVPKETLDPSFYPHDYIDTVQGCDQQDIGVYAGADQVFLSESGGNPPVVGAKLFYEGGYYEIKTAIKNENPIRLADGTFIHGLYKVTLDSHPTGDLSNHAGKYSVLGFPCNQDSPY